MHFVASRPWPGASAAVGRSEERRVGKEWRSRWAPYHLKKKSKRYFPALSFHASACAAKLISRRQPSAPGFSATRACVEKRIPSFSPAAIFLFFQAEDGIRDWSVTGVQTCALPI